MRKILVTYATKSGSVTEIAETIGRSLTEYGAQVDVKPVSQKPDPAGYDAVIVGSGTRGGMWHGPAKTWVVQNREALKARRVAFFSVGMMMTDDEKVDAVKAYTDPLIEETGVNPVDVGTFEGWFVPRAFGFAERTIMKIMKAPEGDFRDFPAVEAWSAAVAPKLGIR